MELTRTEKILASILIFEIITTEIWIYASKTRGYINPGGELLVIPLMFLMNYLIKEIKEIFKIYKNI